MRIVTFAVLLCAVACSESKEGADKSSATGGDGKLAATASGSGSESGTAKAPPVTAEKDPGEPLPALSAAADKTPGLAYLAVEGVGIVVLENGQFTTIIENKLLTRDMHLGADGAVYVSIIGGGVYRIVGKKATKLTAKYHDKLAADKAGNVWAADFKNVYHYQGKAWVTESREDIGDEGSVEDIAFDAAGNVYMASAYQLRMRKPGATAWELIDTSSVTDDKPFFKNILASPDGGVYVAYMQGLLRVKDGVVTKMGLGTGSMFGTRLTLLPTGWVAGGASGKLLLFGPGRQTLEADKDMLGFDPKRVEEVRGDGQGRIWMTTQVGVAVTDDAGKLIQHWKPGSVKGVTGKVRMLEITGGGPTLPTVGAVRKGTVVGSIGWDDGKPIAGKSILICESPKMMFRKTPCEDAAFSLSATTGKDGSFTFKDVPIGPYGFAVKAGPKWSGTMGSRSCCSDLKEGGTLDIGAFSIRRAKNK